MGVAGGEGSVEDQAAVAVLRFLWEELCPWDDDNLAVCVTTRRLARVCRAGDVVQVSQFVL